MAKNDVCCRYLLCYMTTAICDQAQFKCTLVQNLFVSQPCLIQCINTMDKNRQFYLSMNNQVLFTTNFTFVVYKNDIHFE